MDVQLLWHTGKPVAKHLGRLRGAINPLPPLPATTSLLPERQSPPRKRQRSANSSMGGPSLRGGCESSSGTIVAPDCSQDHDPDSEHGSHEGWAPMTHSAARDGEGTAELEQCVVPGLQEECRRTDEMSVRRTDSLLQRTNQFEEGILALHMTARQQRAPCVR